MKFYTVVTQKPSGSFHENSYNTLHGAKIFSRKVMKQLDKPGKYWPFVKIYKRDTESDDLEELIMFMELIGIGPHTTGPYVWNNVS